MNYLIVYPNYDRQTEEKELFADATSATEYIEGILKAGAVKDDQVKLYKLEPVSFQIERIPVVKLEEAAAMDELSFEAATVVPEITTEEEVAEEQARETEGPEESSEEEVEVFTFET